jgi:hypothetical protein
MNVPSIYEGTLKRGQHKLNLRQKKALCTSIKARDASILVSTSVITDNALVRLEAIPSVAFSDFIPRIKEKSVVGLFWYIEKSGVL